MEKFFVISRCGDEPCFTVMDRSTLEKYLNDPEGDFLLGRYRVVSDLKSVDLENFPAFSILILRGDIVIPKAKEKITQYEF